MYIVGFNGPPNSGKDTAAEMLANHLDSKSDLPVRLVSLSQPLRELAYTMVGFVGSYEDEDYAKFKNTYFPSFGKTGRGLMIDISESFLKTTYGETVMVKLLIERNKIFHGVLLIRDCGFQLEVNPLIEWAGRENFYMVRVHRPDTSFDNDSREWTKHPQSSRNFDMPNAGTFDDLNTEVVRAYGRMVNQLGWKL